MKNILLFLLVFSSSLIFAQNIKYKCRDNTRYNHETRRCEEYDITFLDIDNSDAINVLSKYINDYPRLTDSTKEVLSITKKELVPGSLNVRSHWSKITIFEFEFGNCIEEPNLSTPCVKTETFAVNMTKFYRYLYHQRTTVLEGSRENVSLKIEEANKL